MLRLILVAAFLGTWGFCFSEEALQVAKEWQSESLLYLEQGNANLLAHEPWRALEDFQRATSFLDKSDKSSCAIGFLISFGQVVAYDSLGFREQCKQSLGSLLLVINEYDEGEDQDAEIGVQEDSSIDTSEAAVEFLRKLATMTPSQDIRELLLSIVDEMAEELLPAFKFAEQPLLGNADWEFDYGQDVSIYQCKSFWKRIKKIFREVKDVLAYIATGCKAAKEIKDTYENWDKPNP